VERSRQPKERRRDRNGRLREGSGELGDELIALDLVGHDLSPPIVAADAAIVVVVPLVSVPAKLAYFRVSGFQVGNHATDFALPVAIGCRSLFARQVGGFDAASASLNKLIASGMDGLT
jgi:hypothetical protein